MPVTREPQPKPRPRPKPKPRPEPQESKVRKRPGMAHGGKARMKYADGGMPKAKPC